MAYIRGHFYIWGDGAGVNFHHGWDHRKDSPTGDPRCTLTNVIPDKPETEVTHVWLPNEIVEDFACMFWHRLSDDEKQEIMERVSREYGGGNFGADGVQKALGKPTVMEEILKEVD